MKTLLITGGSGYIGGRLFKYFQERGFVTISVTRWNRLVSENSNFYLYDGTLSSLRLIFERHEVDGVIHLASDLQPSASGDAALSMVESNIVFGTQLLEVMCERGCSVMINTGTYWQRDLTGAYAPNSLYAATKQAFEDLVNHYAINRGVKAVTLMLFDVYGPDDPRPKIVNVLHNAILKGEMLELSPGEQRLDFVFIEDVLRGYEVALELASSGMSCVHHRYDLATGTWTSLKNFVETYLRLYGASVDVAWGARSYRDTDRLESFRGPLLPGWSAQVSLDEGLSRVVERHRKTEC